MTSKGSSAIKIPQSEAEAEGYINKFLTVEQEKLEVFSEEDPSPTEWIEFLDNE